MSVKTPGTANTGGGGGGSDDYHRYWYHHPQIVVLPVGQAYCGNTVGLGPSFFS